MCNDQAAADARYKGKILVVRGTVDHVRAGGSEVDLRTDVLYLVRASGVNFSSVKGGQSVILKCRGEGKPGPIALGGCSFATATTPCTPDRATAVADSNGIKLTIEARIQENSVIVAGTATLKDGALIDYEVEHGSFMSSSRNDLMKDGSVSVKAGRFSAIVPIPNWPRGKVKVWVGFQTFSEGQPKWVKDQYGEMGDKMAGPSVRMMTKATKRAEAETAITKP